MHRPAVGRPFRTGEHGLEVVDHLADHSRRAGDEVTEKQLPFRLQPHQRDRPSGAARSCPRRAVQKAPSRVSRSASSRALRASAAGVQSTSSSRIRMLRGPAPPRPSRRRDG